MSDGLVVAVGHNLTLCPTVLNTVGHNLTLCPTVLNTVGHNLTLCPTADRWAVGLKFVGPPA